MTKPLVLEPLYEHGQHVLPIYAVGDRVARSSASLEEIKKRGGKRLRAPRGVFDKTRRASTQPQAYGWIKAIYPEAIEFTSMRQELEGMPMIQAAIGLPAGGGGATIGVWAMTWPFIYSIKGLGYQIFFFLGGLLMAAFSLLFLLYMVGTPLRLLWGGPRDLPVIFDRAHRKVYVMQREVEPGLWGLLKPWPVKACAYEWDLVDAEHHIEVVPNPGSGAQRMHCLAFTVRKSAEDPTLIGHFQVATGLALSEPMVAPLWEHIRRFMQERGPHLPHPSEPLDERRDDRPSWWQAAGRTGPFGPRYLWWWKEHPGITLFYHLIALPGIVAIAWGLSVGASPAMWGALMAPYIPLSVNWGQATGLWLAAHTSRVYEWPQAVRDAIGKPLRKGAGW
ncbi:MAG: hypothetical protein KatS3mg122_3219 [Caldimonas sp.]|nr:MAG: hypothetical protein KatS3mg122_3219 [Caldimonas sp.]